MALRIRETRMIRGIYDQENVTNIKGKAATTVGGTKRAVLGDVSANTQALNKPKEISKKEPLTKLEPLLKTKDLPRPTIQIPTTKVARLPTKVPAVKPFLTGRTLGLKKKDDVPLPKPAEKAKPIVVPSLPLENVHDIDKDDIGKPFLVPEYANEIYAYLRHMEKMYPVRENYLTGQKITPRMRATLVDWMVEVQQQYHLFSETLHLCIAIIDLFLQKVQTITKERLQLVGVTAMLVACKYEETYSPDLSEFVYITDNSFTKEQILAMEKYICGKLDFCFGRPLSLHFLRRYSKAAFATPLQHTMSKYFLELALVDYRMVHVRPSMAAALACLLALYVTSSDLMESLWTNTLVTYSTYSYKVLKPLLPVLASIVVKAPNTKLQAVYKKYCSSKFQKVSLMPELDSDELKTLADTS